jgi:hypothetical protein
MVSTIQIQTLVGREAANQGLVISRNGKAIPPKANDPDAPTLPGLHVNGRHFEFAWSRLTLQGFAFHTVAVDGREFSFEGKFGREQVDVIPDVPYLAGVLTEKRNTRVVQTKRVHFGRAVIL